MRGSIIRRVTTALVAGALVAGTISCGGDDGGEAASTEGRLFQPAGVVGPDSFAPTFELTSYRIPEGAETQKGKVKGNAPGLYAGRTYGGTGKNICDVEAMIRFLTFYADRGRAWAAVQGIDFEQLPSYLRSLTPVYALQNLNVKMFGFKNGKSYGYDAVIAAGTAILIDDQGMPRARCACGNPLLAPNEDEPVAPGDSAPEDTTFEGEESYPGDSTPPEEGGDPPSEGDEPEPQCPELTESGWTDYVTRNGETWRWIASLEGWIKLDDPVSSVVPTSELPGLPEECEPPFDEGWAPEPLCPTEGETTEYYDDWTGEVWTYDPGRAGWTNQSTGDFVSQLSDIPSYARLCDGPQPQDSPCPPFYPLLGTLWQAPDGIFYAYYLNEDLGPMWDDLSTAFPETISNSELQSTYGCDEPYLPSYPECPPDYPVDGDVWQDTTGQWWTYGRHTGGPSGWDSASTGEIEMLETASLPNRPTDRDCDGYSGYQICPPIVADDGDRFVDPITGDAWVYSNLLGGWTREGSSEGVVIVYTALVPGYFEACMPPCPPAQMSSIDNGAWLNPADGTLWIWDGSNLVWVSTNDPTVTVTSSTDLPFYATFCLRPCPPDTGGSSVPSYTRDENGNPTPNPAATAEYGTTDDSAVTVEPSEEGATFESITDEYVRPSTSPYDDCNPSGCVAEGSEPPIGWRWTDSNGVTWTYSGNAVYTSSRGDLVSSVDDIPGFRTTCYQPLTTTEDLPCPPEMKSDPYIDQNGLDWYWVGPNGGDPATSDHGRWWYHRYSDGSTAYKATIELDPWLADCPPPVDQTIEVTPGALSVYVSAPTQLCVGDVANIRVSVTPPPGATVRDVGVEVEGEGIELTPTGTDSWITTYTPTAAGNYTIKAGAEDTEGATATGQTVLVVVDCGTPVDEGQPQEETTTESVPTYNRAPTIRLIARTVCVELPSEGPTTVAVTVRVSDPDDDSLNVELVAESPSGSPGADSYVTPDGTDSRRFEFTLDYRNRGETIVVTGTVNDGELDDVDTLEIVGEYPGGCGSSSSTSSSSSIPSSPPETIDPSNTVPTLTAYDSPTMPVCINSTGSTPVRFRVVDAEGAAVGIQARINGNIATGGYSPSSGTGDQVFTVNLQPIDAGKTLSVTGTDFANVTPAFTATITTKFC